MSSETSEAQWLGPPPPVPTHDGGWGGGGLSWPTAELGRGRNAGDDSPGGTGAGAGLGGGGQVVAPRGGGVPMKSCSEQGVWGSQGLANGRAVIPMGGNAPGKSGAAAWVSGGCWPADGRASLKSMACRSLEGAALRPRSRPPPPRTPPPAFAWIRWPAGGPASRRQSKGPAAIQARTRGLRCPATGRPSYGPREPEVVVEDEVVQRGRVEVRHPHPRTPAPPAEVPLEQAKEAEEGGPCSAPGMPTVGGVGAAVEQAGHALLQNRRGRDQDLPSRELFPQPVGPFTS